MQGVADEDARRTIARLLSAAARGNFRCPCPLCSIVADAFASKSSLIYQPIRRLTFTGSGAWNTSEQTNSPSLINNNPYCTPTIGPYNPTPCVPDYGSPIPGLPNPYGAYGRPLPMSPPFEGNARARYEWVLDYSQRRST